MGKLLEWKRTLFNMDSGGHHSVSEKNAASSGMLNKDETKVPIQRKVRGGIMKEHGSQQAVRSFKGTKSTKDTRKKCNDVSLLVYLPLAANVPLAVYVPLVAYLPLAVYEPLAVCVPLEVYVRLVVYVPLIVCVPHVVGTCTY